MGPDENKKPGSPRKFPSLPEKTTGWWAKGPIKLPV